MSPLIRPTTQASASERSASAIILPIFACFGILSTLPPIIWHARNRNIAACGLIFWTVIGNFFSFTNALIWPTNDVSTWWNGAGFCDIQAKLQWPIITGGAGALCAIMRNLAIVIDVDRAQIRPSKAQRRRAVTVDLLFCLAYPVFFMGIHYVIQPNRYNIITISGCDASYDNSWPTIALALVWPPIFSIATSYYCGKRDNTSHDTDTDDSSRPGLATGPISPTILDDHVILWTESQQVSILTTLRSVMLPLIDPTPYAALLLLRQHRFPQDSLQLEADP
jgi:hypothetical protein